MLYYDETHPAGLSPGDHVILGGIDRPNEEPLVVQGRVPQPGLETETFTVAANDTLANQDMDLLQLPDHWLGSYRLPRIGSELPDGVEILADWGGKSAPAYTAKNSRGAITNETPVVNGYDPDSGSVVTAENLASVFTEMWSYSHSDQPHLTFKNTTGAEVSFSLTFVGWQYKASPSSRSIDQIQNDRSTKLHQVPVSRIRG